MDAALAFEPGEAQFIRGLHLVQRLGGMPVADGHVTLVPQRVVRKPVRLEIQVHVAIGPVEDGMHLEAAVAHFERIQRGAARGLAAAQAREPRGGAERRESAAHGLHFSQLEIFVEPFAALLPELAVLRFEVIDGLRARKGLDVERELLLELLDELVGLGE